MKKLVIIEPHADDAWLNTGAFILENRKKIDIAIVTVFVDEQGPNYTMFLGRLLGIKVISLDYTNIEKEYFDEPKSLDQAFLEKNKVPIQTLHQRIKEMSSGAELWLPEGQRDGNHNLISRMEGDAYYREIPYYWNRRLWQNAEGYEFPELKYEWKMEYPKAVIDYKWQIMNQIYKKKMGFFRWWLPYYDTVRDEVLFSNKEMR